MSDRPKPRRSPEELEAAYDCLTALRRALAARIADPDHFDPIVPTERDFLAIFDLVTALVDGLWPVRVDGTWRVGPPAHPDRVPL